MESKIGTIYTCPAAVVVKNNKILLGYRQYKSGAVWTCPAGRCEDGELIGSTLRREVMEEIGIKDIEILKFLGEVPGAKIGDIVPLFYCAIGQEPTLMEPDKFTEWRWFSLNDFCQGEPKEFINEEARAIICDFINKK